MADKIDLAAALAKADEAGASVRVLIIAQSGLPHFAPAYVPYFESRSLDALRKKIETAPGAEDIRGREAEQADDFSWTVTLPPHQVREFLQDERVADIHLCTVQVWEKFTLAPAV